MQTSLRSCPSWLLGSFYGLAGLMFAGCVSRPVVVDSLDSPKDVLTAQNQIKITNSSSMTADLSAWSLREKIGQLLIVGYRDNEQIEDVMPGGVALFSWSMKTVKQTRALTDEIRELAKAKLKAPLLIATDHEGGRVIRLRNGMTKFPEASAVGGANKPELAKRVGLAVGRELAYLGIDANFAPVLDLGGAESFLGNRIWGENPQQVSQMTGSYIQGLHESGVMSVAKHFPGHGSSPHDAHFSVPVNHKNLLSLWGEDFYPFQHAVIEKVPAMMTAHVRVPGVDRLPASMSPRFLSRILRDTFKFEGVIITDDLEMKGAQEAMLTSGDLALQALIAGSDMLLIVWSKIDQKKIIARLEKAIKTGEWSEGELDRKLVRILSMKAKWLGNNAWQNNHDLQANPMRSVSHLELVKEINDQPIEWRGEHRDSIKSELRSKWGESWRVGLPSSSYAKLWTDWRPRDEVVVFERRMNSQSLKEIRGRFSLGACLKVACVMLTEAANQSSPGLYEHLRQVVGAAEKVEPEARSPATSEAGLFVWAHMGLEPSWKSMNSRSTLALLGASGLPRLQRFLSELKP